MSTKLIALDDAAIRQAAPAVFLRSPVGKVSDEYHFVNTRTIIDRVRDHGFKVVSATQNRVMQRTKNQISNYHEIRFQMQAEALRGIRDVVFPQIVVGNSHDRSRRFSMLAGLWRFACSNGLVVPVIGIGGESLAFAGRALHLKGLKNRIDEMIKSAMDTAQRSVKTIKSMENRKLNDREKRKLVMPILEAWYGDSFKEMETDPLAWTATRRPQDDHDDLWTVMNVAQENFARGGVQLSSGRLTKGFEHTALGVTRTSKLNEALWAHALTFMK